MMCATLLKPEKAKSTAGSSAPPNTASPRCAESTKRDWSGRCAIGNLTLILTVLTFAASIWLYVIVPKGFVPEQDTGLIGGVTDAAQDISFENMSILQQRIADIISHDPDVISVTSYVGVGSDNPTINSGRLYIDIGLAGPQNSLRS